MSHEEGGGIRGNESPMWQGYVSCCIVLYRIVVTRWVSVWVSLDAVLAESQSDGYTRNVTSWYILW